MVQDELAELGRARERRRHGEPQMGDHGIMEALTGHDAKVSHRWPATRIRKIVEVAPRHMAMQRVERILEHRRDTAAQIEEGAAVPPESCLGRAALGRAAAVEPEFSLLAVDQVERKRIAVLGGHGIDEA